MDNLLMFENAERLGFGSSLLNQRVESSRRF
jgi:hypothetical protein